MTIGLTEPTTYEEFMTLCQTIKDKGDMAPIVVGGQDIWHMGFLFHKAYNDQVLSKVRISSSIATREPRTSPMRP